MNRNKLVLILVAMAVAILAIGVLVYLGYNTGHPSIQPKVTITGFNITGISNPVSVAWNTLFVVSYVNNGTTDINNLMITFDTNSSFEMSREMGVFDSLPPHNYVGEFNMGAEYSLGLVKINETREFHGCILNSLRDTAKMNGATFTATLKSSNTFLDQATIYLQGSQYPSDVTCTYHRVSSEIVGKDTRVVFLVTASYNRGDQVTLKYGNFYVSPIHRQNGQNDTYSSPIFANHVTPFETGSVTVDNYNRSSTFQLTFQFQTLYKGFPVSSYPLNYHLETGNSNFIEIVYEDLLNKDS